MMWKDNIGGYEIPEQEKRDNFLSLVVWWVLFFAIPTAIGYYFFDSFSGGALVAVSLQVLWVWHILASLGTRIIYGMNNLSNIKESQ